MVRDQQLSDRSLRRLYEAKASAETAEADSLLTPAPRVRSDGDLVASIVLLKGTPGPADLAHRRALAGADGDAAFKALEALGLPASSTYRACTRPGSQEAPDQIAQRVELLVEAVDPGWVFALDEQAAEDLGRAFGTEVRPGSPVHVRGRTLAAVDGLEASLADERAKARVWAQFKAVVPGPSRSMRKDAR